jgi:transposase InsO family protein
MKISVQTFVSACSVCSEAKPDRAKDPGLLQPVQIPSSAWHIISMDFIEGLLSSGGFNAILVVVDKFTKYGHFLALKHPFTALSVAKLFLAHVYKLHGLPQSIISDRDRIFLSRLWRELFTLAGVQLCMSLAYHPQSDGQTERVNQCLEIFLKCFIHACPS